ncbi:substrate-binding domain-containing protein [Anaerofustis sp. HA2171]|uniref:substrate-binding domain-containing protein n=1 Tax=Anaerofustis butyriciformans TaxID=3108533 RepID=UPI002E2FE16E|nr:substrate-binding domain-containing protein [Anaerofustis sp. HA2171]
MDCYKDISFEQMKEVFLGLLKETKHLQSEYVDVYDSFNRVLFDNVYAKEDVPSYSYSLYDGVAVNIKDIEKKENLYKISEYKKVNKGDFVDDKYNIVIDKHDIIYKGNLIYVNYMPNLFYGIKFKGQERQKGSYLYAKDTLLDSEKIGVLLEARVDKVSVYKKLKIGFVLTLNEEKYKHEKRKHNPETIFMVLKNKIQNERVQINLYPHEREDKRDFEKRVKEASLKNDLVIVIGRTGEGSNDHTYEVIDKLGSVYIKGMNTIPATNFMYGKVLGCDVFAFPGDIFSNIFLYNMFIKKYISLLTRVGEEKENTIMAKLMEDVDSSFYYKEFVYVNLFNNSDGFKALPLQVKNASMYDFFGADGYFVINENVKNIKKGEDIKVHLFKPLKDTDNNVLFVGRKNLINSKIIEYSSFDKMNIIQSSNVNELKGSITSNEYVLGEFEGKSEHFKDELIKGKVIIQGVRERYGFAINKKYLEITDVEDLAKKNIVFGNLPRNDFSRKILETLLKNKKINYKDIKGFEDNIYKNETVLLSALLSDRFDVCFISETAAKNNKIKFVPIITKENDFVINTVDEELVKRIAFVFSNPTLKEELGEDYNTENFGSILRKKK